MHFTKNRIPSTVESQINVSHISDISQINNIVGANKNSFYYISASQINDNLTLRINLPLTNNIVNLRFDCTCSDLKSNNVVRERVSHYYRIGNSIRA